MGSRDTSTVRPLTDAALGEANSIETQRRRSRGPTRRRPDDRHALDHPGRDGGSSARTGGQAAVDSGAIKPHTGYELSRVADPVEQHELAEQAKAGNLKRDDLRQRVAKNKEPKARGKAKVVTSRKFKFAGGLVITAERASGLDPLALIEALRSAATEVEASDVPA